MGEEGNIVPLAGMRGGHRKSDFSEDQLLNWKNNFSR